VNGRGRSDLDPQRVASFEPDQREQIAGERRLSRAAAFAPFTRSPACGAIFQEQLRVVGGPRRPTVDPLVEASSVRGAPADGQVIVECVEAADGDRDLAANRAVADAATSEGVVAAARPARQLRVVVLVP